MLLNITMAYIRFWLSMNISTFGPSVILRSSDYGSINLKCLELYFGTKNQQFWCLLMLVSWPLLAKESKEEFIKKGKRHLRNKLMRRIRSISKKLKECMTNIYSFARFLWSFIDSSQYEILDITSISSEFIFHRHMTTYYIFISYCNSWNRKQRILL